MNACIVYLVDSWDVDNFKRSLDLLVQVESLKKYPIIAFHEHHLLAQVKEEASKWGVKFVEINFVMPDYSSEIRDQIKEDFIVDGCPFPFTLGYRHMCRFFSGEIFKHEALAQFDWVMRIDTDSFMLDSTIEDPIAATAAMGAVYGYRTTRGDNPICYRGFYDNFREGLKELGLPYRLPIEGLVYYTNWEVMDMRVFRGKIHQSLYETIDRSGGIFIHRWGDHIFRWAFLTQFDLPVRHFWFKYGHGSEVIEARQP